MSGVGRRARGARRFRTVSGGVAWRSLHNFFTNPALLLPATVFPLFFYAAFAGGLTGVSRAPGFEFEAGYATFQFGFVLVQAAAFGGVFAGFGIARDFESGMGRRLMVAAPNRLGILAGYALAAAARAAWVVSVLFAVALATGMRLEASAGELATLVGLALLINLTACLWAAGIALRFRSMQAAPLMQTPVFLVLFLTPVFAPADLLADWMRRAANVNPLTPVIEAARSLLAGAPHDIGLAFAAAVALVVFFGAWGYRGLKRAEAQGS